jgi:hypothetical protein
VAGSGWVQFSGTEPRDDALDHPIGFPPPGAHLAANPDAFAYWWHLIQFVFGLPDPSQFPALPPFEDRDLMILRRYIDTCRELAQSSVLSHRTLLEVRQVGEGVDMTTSLPTTEAVRGTDVLFRQVQESREPASYASVRKLIGRRIHETDDRHSLQRNEWERRWRRAHAKLNAFLLTYLADMKALGRPEPSGIQFERAQKVTDEDRWPGDDVHPHLILSLFRYGHLIHYGHRREEFALLASDAHEMNFAWMKFLRVLHQLSHFYIGYSVLVASAARVETS